MQRQGHRGQSWVTNIVEILLTGGKEEGIQLCSKADAATIRLSEWPGSNRKFILGVFVFRPFLSFSFPLLQSGPSNTAKGFGGVLLAFPSGGWENDICSLPGMFPEPRPQKHFGVFRAQGTCLMGAYVVLLLLNEI